jgi:ubiquinone/menaquinone biosynthesis C-methylase UbiE
MTKHFDLVAREWDNNEIHIKRTKAIAKCLIEKITVNKKMTALEFGAGTGLLSFALQDKFAEITLMDSSKEMIKTTFEKIVYAGNHRLKPVFFDLEKKMFSDKTFDVIFTQMAMHHVMDIEKMIAKFFKLLNRGGKLAIADLYAEDGSFHDMEFEGHNGFDPYHLSELIKGKGFINVTYKQCFVIEKTGLLDTLKKYPVFLLTAEKK